MKNNKEICKKRTITIKDREVHRNRRRAMIRINNISFPALCKAFEMLRNRENEK